MEMTAAKPRDEVVSRRFQRALAADDLQADPHAAGYRHRRGA